MFTSVFPLDYPILQSLDFNVTYCQARGESQPYHPAIWVAV